MTEASTGLRKALARGQNGTVQTLAEMSNEDLIANLSDEQKAALAASMAAAAAAKDMPEPEGEDGEEEAEAGDDAEPKSKKKDDYTGDDKAKASDETQRAVAVLTHEHAQGRMDLAKNLLANDKLSADEIIGILSASAPEKPADPEAAARAEMQAALQANSNSAIEANNAGTKPGANASASIWDKTYAKLGLAEQKA